MKELLDELENLLKETIFCYGLDACLASASNFNAKDYLIITENYRKNFNKNKISKQVYNTSYDYVYSFLKNYNINIDEIIDYYELNELDYEYMSGFIIYIYDKKMNKIRRR